MRITARTRNCHMALLGALRDVQITRPVAGRGVVSGQWLTAKAAINAQAANTAATATAPQRSHRLPLGVVDEGSSTIR